MYINKNDNKLDNIILHITHDNPYLPDDMRELLADLDKVKFFSEQISDIVNDELFSHDIGVVYSVQFSSVYCAVEKYIDDEQEVMSKYGQGVFYSKDCEVNRFRNVSSEYKDRIAKDYSIPYNKGLDELTLSLLYKRLIIVDCHSCGEECVLHEKSNIYVDICLGFGKQ